MKHRLLFIEDDEDILDILKYIFRYEDYDVYGMNSFDCIDSVLAIQPAMIILDERLPNIWGHEICAILKTHPEFESIPIVLLSAVQNLEEIAKCCHADAYIAKPFDLAEVISSVQRLITPKSCRE